MELENQINNNLEIKNEQNKFFDTFFGKAIDNGIDIALRYLLPDYIEDGVIEFKDNMIDYGLKDGISKSIESVINTGKNAIGILTGDFKNILMKDKETINFPEVIRGTHEQGREIVLIIEGTEKKTKENE